MFKVDNTAVRIKYTHYPCGNIDESYPNQHDIVYVFNILLNKGLFILC